MRHDSTYRCDPLNDTDRADSHLNRFSSRRLNHQSAFPAGAESTRLPGSNRQSAESAHRSESATQIRQSIHQRFAAGAAAAHVPSRRDSYNIYVNHLPPNATKGCLFHLFSSYGTILDLFVHAGRGSSDALVMFDSPDAAGRIRTAIVST